MTYEEMEKLVEGEFVRIRELRASKGREYAGEEDTLADFKEIAAETDVSPLVVWSVYVKKHERAIDTFIREGSTKSESIEERVRDVIVYHLLLLGLLKDGDSEPTERTVDSGVDGWGDTTTPLSRPASAGINRSTVSHIGHRAKLNIDNETGERTLRCLDCQLDLEAAPGLQLTDVPPDLARPTQLGSRFN